MMTDYHIHTVFCDGKNTPEEIVEAALNKNIGEIGFSGHSYVEFDPQYSMSPEDTQKYFEEIKRLKKKYHNSISILCGIEQDYFSNEPTSCYDYVIGSVHYLKCDDLYIPVDMDKETLVSAAERFFNRDIYSLIEQYYDLVGNIVEKTGCDIVGHFDLVEKFNEDGSLFDRNNERYKAAYRNAVDRLLKYNVPFEINTGAISRGYRTQPYPDFEILKYICNGGGKVVLCSDSHSDTNLCFNFREAEQIAFSSGFKKIEKELKNCRK